MGGVLAFFGNLAPTEVLVLAVVAVLVFGKRLPEVAGRGFTQLRRWRQSLDQLRRETGIDQELRNIERGVRDVQRRANVEAFLREEPVTPVVDPAGADPPGFAPPVVAPPVEASPESELPQSEDEPAKTDPKP